MQLYKEVIFLIFTANFELKQMFMTLSEGELNWLFTFIIDDDEKMLMTIITMTIR